MVTSNCSVLGKTEQHSKAVESRGWRKNPAAPHQNTCKHIGRDLIHALGPRREAIGRSAAGRAEKAASTVASGIKGTSPPSSTFLISERALQQQDDKKQGIWMGILLRHTSSLT